ncbi:MAG: hypothetical protein SNJ71_02465, partial [Bacteroidales bacterium]
GDAQETLKDGTKVMNNKNLDFTKAMHYVLGYTNSITNDLVFKSEVYYQDLYDVPILPNDSSTFSALNASDGFMPSKLINKGTGENYGLEMTLEKFFTKSYNFTFTTSLYNSTYKTLTGKTYNTKYNGNYVFNLLGGKEIALSKKNDKVRIVTLGAKATYAGGQRYSPINLQKSIKANNTVRDETNPWTLKRDDYFVVDARIELRTELKKITHYWEIEIQNLTNNKIVGDDYFNKTTQSIQKVRNIGIIPVLSFRIEF